MESKVLEEILSLIYANPKNLNPIGDGKVSAALLHELASGQKTYGKWHAQDAADLLIRLVDALDGNSQKPGAITAPRDKAIALQEIDEIWRALNQEVDSIDNPALAAIRKNPAMLRSVQAAERSVLKSPALAEISGTVFRTYPGRRPVPEMPLRTGKVLGGITGGTLGIIDFYWIFKDAYGIANDPLYACKIGLQECPVTEFV